MLLEITTLELNPLKHTAVYKNTKTQLLQAVNELHLSSNDKHADVMGHRWVSE